jgi:thiol-disulfide isomerase/thioredoxin
LIAGRVKPHPFCCKRITTVVFTHPARGLRAPFSEVTMNRLRIWICGTAVLCSSLVTAAVSRSEERSPDTILAEIDAIKELTFDAARQKNRAYVQQLTRKRKDAASQKAKLIGELYRADPGNPRLVTLLPERWRARFAAVTGMSAAKELASELNQVLAGTESDELRKEAHYWKARIGIVVGRGDDAKVKAVDGFIALDPKDARGAELLATLMSRYVTAPDTKQALAKRLASEYPETSGSEPQSGAESLSPAVGKPFVLQFVDAISGAPVSTERLKGKVVVVDFWATWCGPCVAEMPRMKQLYAEFRNKGVQFIGVSLDQSGDGYDKLVAFVEENGIAWPQYYQGNGWNSEFSKSWGIRAIPAVFVVDQEGKVYSDKARGKLQTILPELLKHRPNQSGARSIAS